MKLVWSFVVDFPRWFWPSLSSTGIWPQSMKSTWSLSHWCDSWEATGNTVKTWSLLPLLNSWNLSIVSVSVTQRGAVHRASEHSHNVHSEEGESPSVDEQFKGLKLRFFLTQFPNKQGMFEPFMKSFYVRSTDATHIKTLKVMIFVHQLPQQGILSS